MGLGTIARRLNAVAPWSPPPKKGGRSRKDGKERGTGWRDSYVKKILSNRAVLGEYQPHEYPHGEQAPGKRVPVGEAIPGYFPAIIDPGVFQKVQERLGENHHTDKDGRVIGRGGRIGKAGNLFVHLARCAYCGGPMVFRDRGKPGGHHGRKTYLVCDNGRRGVRDGKGRPVCARRSIRYDECERLLLDHCIELRPEQVLPNPGERDRLAQSLRQRLQGKDAELRDIERKLDNLADLMIDTDDKEMRGRYQVKADQLQGRRAALEREKAQDEKQLKAAEQGAESFAEWKRNMEALRKALEGGDVEVRQRMRAHLRELIDKIEVFTDGVTKERDDFDLRPPESYPEKYRAFLRFVEKHRMTKEGGRFIRVHFKTGLMLGLWPVDSFASGVTLARGFDGEWAFAFPRHKQAFQEFQARNAAAEEKERHAGNGTTKGKQKGKGKVRVSP